MSKEQEQEQKKAVEQKKQPPAQKKKEKKSVNFNAEIIKNTLINYIVPLICIAASVLIGVFILMPSYRELPELQAELEKNSRLERVLEDKLRNLNKLVDFEGIVEENSDLVNKVLVSEGLVPGLLTQIDKIASESGLTVNRLNYGLKGAGASGTGEGGSDYDIVTVNMDATGNFEQLKTFMNSIENAARIVIVENYRYTLNTSGDETKLGMNFVLDSPYLYVESDAITDDPVDLDISDNDFQDLITKIKAMKYYDPYEIDLTIPVEEAPAEGEEATTDQPPAEQPPAEQPPAEQPPAAPETPEEPVDETPADEGESLFP